MFVLMTQTFNSALELWIHRALIFTSLKRNSWIFIHQIRFALASLTLSSFKAKFMILLIGDVSLCCWRKDFQGTAMRFRTMYSIIGTITK